jgi:hypothetical protein
MVTICNEKKEDFIMAEKTEGLVYRGHPLRRVDNLIYYGSMADKYIIMMQVLDTEDVKDLKLAKRVSIQLQLTDATLRSRDRVVRSTEKASLSEAMEFASIWLERALSGKI